MLSDAVDELLRMQMMSTSTQGLLLACAAAVSGASYTDAAPYSHSLSSAPTATAA